MLRVIDILRATGGILHGSASAVFTGVSIDSRTIKEGELFIPIKGERFDGHDFVVESLKTAGGAVVSTEWLEANREAFTNRPLIAVDDTLFALQRLAAHLRGTFRGHVVAVVGSNGKTTTKELVCSILAAKYGVLKTEGNLNNHIGMPLSMTRGDEKTGVMVLEMGTNRPGDIDALCQIAAPDIGVITNLGMEHLEGFGSFEAVRDEELRILEYLDTVAINGDDEFLLGGISLKFQGNVITYGISNTGSDIIARSISCTDEGTQFDLAAGAESVLINSRLCGRFNVYNSLAAAAVARGMGFSLEEIRQGLEAFSGVKMRFEVRRIKGVTYLYDVYNANPSSMKAAIEELLRVSRANGGRAVAVLGDMLELGDFAESAHKEVGAMLRDSGVELFIGAGPLMKSAVASFGAGAMGVEDSEYAGEELGRHIKEGDIVLIKGSRGMKMERVMEAMEKRSAEGGAL